LSHASPAREFARRGVSPHRGRPRRASRKIFAGREGGSGAKIASSRSGEIGSPSGVTAYAAELIDAIRPDGDTIKLAAPAPC
jgi:hypothetical protein